MRVIRAEPARRVILEVLHQPGGHIHDAGGVPKVPHVRDAIGGGPAMPQMQEHCSARCHP